jgi:hypothetical protein
MIRPLIAALALSACAAPELATRRIGNDNGGVVTEYIARADSLRGQPVVITGERHSACAMIASLPSACLGPRARVGLHWPYVKVGETVAGPHANSPWFDRVTPQIAQAVRAMPFDYTRAGDVKLIVTPKNAAAFGLRVCEG